MRELPRKSSPVNDDSKVYWRSLGQLNGSEEFKEWLHREFQPNATEPPAVKR